MTIGGEDQISTLLDFWEDIMEEWTGFCDTRIRLHKSKDNGTFLDNAKDLHRSARTHGSRYWAEFMYSRGKFPQSDAVDKQTALQRQHTFPKTHGGQSMRNYDSDGVFLTQYKNEFSW